MTARDRERVADLAMRAIDTIIEDYGPDAELVAACLVFEVRTGAGDDERWDVTYKSLPGNSPNHIAGLMHSMAAYLEIPES
jgi:hypothetical protein